MTRTPRYPMKSHASFLAALALLASAGCDVDTPSGIVLDGFHPLVFDETSQDCTHAEADQWNTSGTYDAGFGQLGRSFYKYLHVRNTLPANEDLSAGRLNTNDFQLIAIEITIDNSGPWKFLPASQSVPLSSGVQVNGTAFVEVPLISPTLAAAMVQGTPESPSPVGAEGDSFPLLLRVRARGQLLDGSDVETNELQFPVTITNQRARANCGTGQIPAGCGLIALTDTIVPVQYDGWSCIDVDPP